MKQYFFLAIFCIISLSLAIPVSKAQSVTIDVADYQPLNSMCRDNFILGATIDIIVDGAGTANYISITTSYLGSFIGNSTQNYPSGQALPFTANNLWITRAFGFGTVPDNTDIDVLVELDVDGTVYSLGFTINCTTLVASFQDSPTVSPTSHDSGINYPPDNRINWQFGDTHIGILYAGADGTLDLYVYETNSYIFDFITPDNIEPFIDSPPDVNTLIRSEGQISVYVLATGQIQFNFGPDNEGKIWVFIMNDLTDYEAEDSYYIDPNE